ncbi:PfkB family carbohydrate kinase [Haloarcula sp. S1AR25-5A]|uniref:PfkB family carbohydrate kinase n=1 Tax=Haloarcula terrestris TaxID=2950533 RepID=A0AAE4F211_9EURY|nr:PfkB family carbohydrate kinase [Haloarcula terrestris]MDS0223397.1 PfkB family carbohydrate kinase [Haloarcula terrestris]
MVFGFDGYVDNVRRAGTNAGASDSDRITTLSEFGEEIVTSAAADSSLSISWERHGQRTGGHVSHLSRAYQTLGFDPTLVGMCGDPVRDIFEQEFEACTLYSLGDPGITDAIEFDDGKLMLMENGGAATLDWETIRSRVGVETLVDELEGAKLLGIGYWAVMPEMAGILDGLREMVFPELTDPPEHVLLDPANIRELDPEILESIVAATRRLADEVDMTVSANRYETKELAAALGGHTSDEIVADARVAFDSLAVDRFVGHSVDESVVVSDDGTTSVRVAPVESPELTTSAGDHFNAGLSLGLVEGVPDAAAVVLGNALAREFVRTGETPSYDDVVSAVTAYAAQFE